MVERILKVLNQLKTIQHKSMLHKTEPVTSTDFESLIPTLYPETESVSAFGGD